MNPVGRAPCHLNPEDGAHAHDADEQHLPA
jgi:hypothetical protein